MSIILSLLSSDLKAIRSWFAQQGFSKLLVIGGFAGLFFLISFTLYKISGLFFQSLTFFEEFGFLTAEYIIKAGMILIFWLGIGSSVISTLGIFLTGNKNLEYLLTLPIKPKYLYTSLFLKNIISNTVFLFIFLAPVTFAFYQNFLTDYFIFFLIKMFLVLIFVAILTNTIGGLIAYFLAGKISGRSYTFYFFGFLVFFFFMILIFKLIFPASMMGLSESSTGEFYRIYNNLPLTSYFIPTNWLVGIITQGDVFGYLSSLILALLSIAVYFYIQKFNFLKNFIGLNETKQLPDNKEGGLILFRNLGIEKKYSGNKALILKDILSILRVPAESGYAVFIYLMMFSFFMFFAFVRIPLHTAKEIFARLAVFSFLWLIFFGEAYLLRLSYPLMARENEAFWFLFSQPLKMKNIINSKLATSLILLLPLVLFSILIWLFLPFAGDKKLLLIFVSIFTLLVLGVVNTIMGIVKPYFSLGSEPEKTSTSLGGIATLLIATIICAGMAYLMYNYFLGKIYLPYLLLFLVLVIFLPVTIFTYLEENLIKRYEQG